MKPFYDVIIVGAGVGGTALGQEVSALSWRAEAALSAQIRSSRP